MDSVNINPSLRTIPSPNRVSSLPSRHVSNFGLAKGLNVESLRIDEKEMAARPGEMRHRQLQVSSQKVKLERQSVLFRLWSHFAARSCLFPSSRGTPEGKRICALIKNEYDTNNISTRQIIKTFNSNNKPSSEARTLTQNYIYRQPKLNPVVQYKNFKMKLQLLCSAVFLMLSTVVSGESSIPKVRLTSVPGQ